jgi:hypothetical protein
MRSGVDLFSPPNSRHHDVALELELVGQMRQQLLALKVATVAWSLSMRLVEQWRLNHFPSPVRRKLGQFQLVLRQQCFMQLALVAVALSPQAQKVAVAVLLRANLA